MLGLLLIYFIGKYFYTLADTHGKNKWVFAILGIATYYLGTFVGGLVIGIGLELWGEGTVDDMSSLMLGLIALPFGLAACTGMYFILKMSWKETPN
jgi:hypothetical protein